MEGGGSSANDDCPICLSTLRNPLRTNCGHVFCRSCLVSLRVYGGQISTFRCPCCRSHISSLEPHNALTDSAVANASTAKATRRRLGKEICAALRAEREAVEWAERDVRHSRGELLTTREYGPASVASSARGASAARAVSAARASGALGAEAEARERGLQRLELEAQLVIREREARMHREAQLVGIVPSGRTPLERETERMASAREARRQREAYHEEVMRPLQEASVRREAERNRRRSSLLGTPNPLADTLANMDSVPGASSRLAFLQSNL